jgi:mono/diheme cytochrome c family protein
MSSRLRLAGALLAACLGVAGCTGRDILAMRRHPQVEQPVTSGNAGATPSTFTGPPLAATTTYPRNEDAPRPEPPAQYASLRNPLPASPENIAKGKAIFDANCAVCHGTGGLGNGPTAGSLNPKPINFTTPIHKELPDGYWFWRVSKGGGVPPFSTAGSAMPPWEGSLTTQQRWLVILYEHTFSGATSGAAAAPGAPGPALAASTSYPRDENAPRPEPPAQYASLRNPLSASPENIAKGKAIFDANCAVCHGTGGLGNGSAAGALNPKPINFTTPIHRRLPDGYWFWRVSKGGGVPPFSTAGSAMPPWEGSLSEEQRWLVILYEHTFARP